MPTYVTAADITTLVLSGKTPTAADTTWATTVAAAVNAGMAIKLGSTVIVDPSPAFDELKLAAHLAGAEAFKRKEAIFGLTGQADMEGAAIRVARDYLSGVSPLIERYNSGPGIG